MFSVCVGIVFCMYCSVWVVRVIILGLVVGVVWDSVVARLLVFGGGGVVVWLVSGSMKSRDIMGSM